MNSIQTIRYEFPLSERYRTFLKLEHLFKLLRHRMHQYFPDDFLLSLQHLTDIAQLLQKTPLQKELLDELAHYQYTLTRLSETPAIDKIALEQILYKISTNIESLNGFSTSDLTYMKTDLIRTYTKRNEIMCGTIAFDTPLIQFWAEQDAETKSTLLQSWTEAFAPVENALLLLLHLVRQSAYAKRETAKQGKYFLKLPAQSEYLFIQIEYDSALNVYPSISGGHQRFYIHFIELDTQNSAASAPSTADLPFMLTLCSLT